MCSKCGASNEGSEKFVWCETLEDRQFNTHVQHTTIRTRETDRFREI